MTPEQMAKIRVLAVAYGRLTDSAYSDHARSELESELSHYARIPLPRPPAERRCGQCGHSIVCGMFTAPDSSPRQIECASACSHYDDRGWP